MSDPRMAALVKGLRRKTAQVRALAGGGYGSAEIARFLGLGEAYVAKVMGGEPVAAPADAPAEGPVAGVVGPDGRIDPPAGLAAAAGLAPGTPVVLRVEGRSLIVTPRAAAEAEVRAFAGARLPR